MSTNHVWGGVGTVNDNVLTQTRSFDFDKETFDELFSAASNNPRLLNLLTHTYDQYKTTLAPEQSLRFVSTEQPELSSSDPPAQQQHCNFTSSDVFRLDNFNAHSFKQSFVFELPDDDSEDEDEGMEEEDSDPPASASHLATTSEAVQQDQPQKDSSPLQEDCEETTRKAPVEPQTQQSVTPPPVSSQQHSAPLTDATRREQLSTSTGWYCGGAATTITERTAKDCQQPPPPTIAEETLPPDSEPDGTVPHGQPHFGQQHQERTTAQDGTPLTAVNCTDPSLQQQYPPLETQQQVWTTAPQPPTGSMPCLVSSIPNSPWDVQRLQQLQQVQQRPPGGIHQPGTSIGMNSNGAPAGAVVGCGLQGMLQQSYAQEAGGGYKPQWWCGTPEQAPQQLHTMVAMQQQHSTTSGQRAETVPKYPAPFPLNTQMLPQQQQKGNTATCINGGINNRSQSDYPQQQLPPQGDATMSQQYQQRVPDCQSTILQSFLTDQQRYRGSGGQQQDDSSSLDFSNSSGSGSPAWSAPEQPTLQPDQQPTAGLDMMLSHHHHPHQQQSDCGSSTSSFQQDPSNTRIQHSHNTTMGMALSFQPSDITSVRPQNIAAQSSQLLYTHLQCEDQPATLYCGSPATSAFSSFPSPEGGASCDNSLVGCAELLQPAAEQSQPGGLPLGITNTVNDSLSVTQFDPGTGYSPHQQQGYGTLPPHVMASGQPPPDRPPPPDDGSRLPPSQPPMSGSHRKISPEILGIPENVYEQFIRIFDLRDTAECKGYHLLEEHKWSNFKCKYQLFFKGYFATLRKKYGVDLPEKIPALNHGEDWFCWFHNFTRANDGGLRLEARYKEKKSNKKNQPEKKLDGVFVSRVPATSEHKTADGAVVVMPKDTRDSFRRWLVEKNRFSTKTKTKLDKTSAPNPKRARTNPSSELSAQEPAEESPVNPVEAPPGWQPPAGLSQCGSPSDFGIPHSGFLPSPFFT